jgi:hypothetical protein
MLASRLPRNLNITSAELAARGWASRHATNTAGGSRSPGLSTWAAQTFAENAAADLAGTCVRAECVISDRDRPHTEG